RKVPCCVPRILPFIGHGDDVIVHHVEPFAIPNGSRAWPKGFRTMLFQPFGNVQAEILFAPKHSRERLTHHASRIFAGSRRRDAPKEIICFRAPRPHSFVELTAEWFAELSRWDIAQAQADCGGFARSNPDPIVCGGLGSGSLWIHTGRCTA